MIQGRQFYVGPACAKRSTTARPEFVAPRQARTAETLLIVPEILRNQQNFGSCIGQSTAFATSSSVYPTSGRFLWVEARRHDLDLAGVDDGTNFDAAFWVVENVGVAAYDATENDGTPQNIDIAQFGPHLDSELQASDHKFTLNVSSVNPSAGNAFDLIVAAIASGHRVTFASGLHDAFFSLAPGQIATANELGGNDNGHAQAFCGFDLRTRQLFVLNSWGDFAGLIVAKADYTDPRWPGQIDRGTFWELPGAYAITAETLPALWEIHVVEVVR